jgi:formiminoglutamate deiminase
VAHRFWCELAWLGGDSAAGDVLITVADGVVTAIATGVECPHDATPLAGLTIPGLANAHSHAFHRALRSRTQAGTGSFWTWRDQMYSLAAALTPESYGRLARAVYGEMALAGVTCVGEFHYLHHQADGLPYAEPNAMGAALIDAAAQAGIRITLLDTCYLRGGVAPDGSDVALDAVQRRFSDGDAHAWGRRADAVVELSSPTCRIGAAIHSVRAVGPAAIEVVTRWAADRGVPLHAHVSEQPAENEQCFQAYGLTPTALLAGRGTLGAHFTAVHATHLSDADIDLYGAHGCTICMCPTTERDLADGIGPTRPLRDAGARLSLGSDSHAVIDLFEEARGVELDERLATRVRGSHDAPSLLAMAATHGHACLGWPEAGVIAVGASADLVSVRLDSVRTAGAGSSSALEAVVFAAGAADVHHVVVGGQVVVADGRHQRFDVAAALEAAIAEVTAAPSAVHG